MSYGAAAVPSPLTTHHSSLRPGVAIHPDYSSPPEAIRLARLAEDAGLGTIWVPETWGRDAVTFLTQLALATSRIRLGTGIMPIFNRTAATIAQTIASLDELTGGRAVLGLGTSGPKVVQDWHGEPYVKPLQRTREYVDIIRLALSGKRVNYDGQLFHLRDFALNRVRPVQERIPIYLAVIGPKNIELAGEVADGWLPIFTSIKHLDTLRAQLAVGAQRASRSVNDVAIDAFVGTCVSGDVERDRHLLRRQIAFYVGGMGAYYNRLVSEVYGYRDVAAGVLREFQAGRRDVAASLIPDELLEDVCIMGPPERARERVAAYLAAGVTPVLNPPQGITIEEAEATIRALSS